MKWGPFEKPLRLITIQTPVEIMAGFNQKPSFRKGKPSDSGAGKRPTFRPEKTENRGTEKPRFDNDRPRDRNFDDRPPRRSFNDQPDGRERRSFDRGSSFDRPKRNFDNDRPRDRNSDDRPPRRSFNDQPDGRERRSFDRGSSFDRPKRNFDNDRPRDKNSDDRPPHRSFNDQSDGRERRSFDRGSSFDRPKRSFDNDRPRERNSDDRPPRRSFNDQPDGRERRSFDRGSSFDRPKRSFDNDRPRERNSDDRAPRRSSNDQSDRKSSDKFSAKRGEERRRFDDNADNRVQSFDRNQQFINDDDFFEKKPESGGFIKKVEEKAKPDKPVFEDHFQFSRTDKPEFTNHLTAENEAADVEKEEMRLNKYVALSGIASRRTAAEYIKNKEVTVNEVVVVEPGYRVQPSDVIKYKGAVISPVKELVYLLLNKPKNVITTVSDAQGRKTVLDLVENATDNRIYPVGRLDRDTTGLLILTNDGDLARKLSHPSNDVKKIYQVTLDRPVSVRDLEKIQVGLELEDGIAEVDAVGHIDGGKRNEVGIEIHIGKNRIVRRIFEHLGYEVEKLDRVYYAGLTKKDLPRGHYRKLTEKELIMLKHFI